MVKEQCMRNRYEVESKSDDADDADDADCDNMATSGGS